MAALNSPLNRTAFSATLHCLTGCSIGEVLEMAGALQISGGGTRENAGLLPRARWGVLGTVKVEFLDLGRQTAALRPELDLAVHRVLAAGRFVGGDEVEAFEQEFAAHDTAGR